MTAILELEDVTLAHGATSIASGLSLTVERGETLALVGPSGSGKTSVLRALLGLFVPFRGIVRIDGKVASVDSRIVIAPESRRLAVVFQDLALWPHMTVEGNLGFALEARGVPRAERADRVHATLDSLGLTGKERRYPRELSGGEKQRVALARALVVKPAAVLLDEPLTSLDPILKREMLDLLATTLVDASITALYVTHALDEARRLGTRVAVLDAGRVAQIGTWRDLCARPATPLVRALVALA